MKPSPQNNNVFLVDEWFYTSIDGNNIAEYILSRVGSRPTLAPPIMRIPCGLAYGTMDLLLQAASSWRTQYRGGPLEAQGRYQYDVGKLQ